MMVNEFIEKVADGEINDIDIRRFFGGLSDFDKSGLLEDMFIESLADGISAHNDEGRRLADAINMLCGVFEWRYDNVEKKYIYEPKQGPEQANNGQTTDAQSLNPEPQQMELKDLLPEKLKADEAVKVFQKAIDAQLITNSPEGLKRNDTKQLLAYFATKVSEKFSLTTRLDKDGNKTTAWKPFETLFNEKGLKGAKQNWMRLNTKFEPTGFEKVDALF
ncbi:MAG: hypothetical protein IJ659_00305 [Alloprevotella sp.]|nr:hypothetical protein [Alloprevotella sp.]